MHCPFWSVFLHCPSLAPCYVLPFWAKLCLPLLVSVLCTDHNGHCAYALPFWGTMLCTALLGHCALHCPFWAVFCTTPLCTVLCTAPIFGLYFYCPSRGTMLCALPFWVSVLCSANYAIPVWAVLHYPSGNCALHYPYVWAVFSLSF